MNDSYAPVAIAETDEFLDGDIDRSEFDKYLSGYGSSHHTSSTVSCAFYSGLALTDGPSAAAAVATQLDGHKEGITGGSVNLHQHTNDYLNAMKHEPLYENVPTVGSSSLSSALADVRSVYYDC